MQEINDELQPVYNHLDSLAIPRYSDFDRWFACKCITARQAMLFKSIDHINRIRRIKVNDTKTDKELDVAKAKAVPIETLYQFVKKGKVVSCPFHEDKHPSASIRYNRLVCFQCGFKGDGIAFMMELNNVGFKEAVRLINGAM